MPCILEKRIGLFLRASDRSQINDDLSTTIEVCVDRIAIDESKDQTIDSRRIGIIEVAEMRTGVSRIVIRLRMVVKVKERVIALVKHCV